MGFFNKLFSKKEKETLDQGLQKTKEGVWNKITRAVAGKSKIDEDVLDALEHSSQVMWVLTLRLKSSTGYRTVSLATNTWVAAS